MCKSLLSLLILSLGLVISTLDAAAQSPQIDTILVNLSNDSNLIEKKELTPALNLKLMREKAAEDSIKLAEKISDKAELEKQRLLDLKEQRKKEKEAKELAQKELIEQKRKEKEERIKAVAEKKAQAEQELKEKLAANKKEKEQKELAKELTKKKENTEKTETALVSTAPIKNEDSILQATQQKIDEENAAKLLAEQQKQLELEKENELAQKRQSEEVQIQKINEAMALKKKAEANPDLPIVPEGVKQKDNVYGTVRLAYDDLAASFLLSIPTETKMHYHKDHSEHIILIEGEGMVLMGYKTIKLKKNELVFVSQGTPHKIINSGKGSLKVLSIQSPFYDGSDITILE